MTKSQYELVLAVFQDEQPISGCYAVFFRRRIHLSFDFITSADWQIGAKGL